MTQLDELKASKELFLSKIKDYTNQLKTLQNSNQRLSLKSKITAYRSAVRDIQTQIDYLDPPEERKARKEQRKRLDIGSLTWDWFERNGEAWSDIEGHTWQQMQDGDFTQVEGDSAKLQQWLAEGSQRLTERQRLYIDAYYNQGLSLIMIAELYGVDKSVVSRVIKNGLARMQNWVDAKKLGESCAKEAGIFDWNKYISENPVLTDRQRQLMLIALSRCPHTQTELAEKLDLKQSTVWHTMSIAKNTIDKLNVRGGRPSELPRITNWVQSDKFSLALDTGMPLYFYYRYCFRDQKIGGVSRYNYELSRRREAGVSANDAAEELGLETKTVQSAYSKLKRQAVKVGHIPLPQDGTIGAHLDPETYVKLQRLVTGNAST